MDPTTQIIKGKTARDFILPVWVSGRVCLSVASFLSVSLVMTTQKAQVPPSFSLLFFKSCIPQDVMKKVFEKKITELTVSDVNGSFTKGCEVYDLNGKIGYRTRAISERVYYCFKPLFWTGFHLKNNIKLHSTYQKKQGARYIRVRSKMARVRYILLIFHTQK